MPNTQEDMENLKKLGYDDWFQNQADTEKSAMHEAARVVAVHKGSCVITRGRREAFAELSGNLLYTAGSSSDLPTTGDWVYADFYDEDSHAIIHGVMPRKTLLKRKTAGKQVEHQLIAANIDVAFIIQSLDNDLNLRRMERYLVMVNECNITPTILLSKCDLVSQAALEEIEENISAIASGTAVLAFSTVSGTNIDAIKGSLLPAHTYCLLGSSGVGKTTLLNSILGSEKFETRAVRQKDSKGRHTTTSRELVQLENGALLIDTPGMRELGSMSVDAGLDETFSEISELVQRCRFGNCSHTSEIGCAVLRAMNEGELTEQRWNSYRKMKNESAFNEMSYVEKRKKDKAFGKLVKSTLKNQNKR